MRYEEIAQRPATALARICEFNRGEHEEAMLEFDDHVTHITNGNSMRFSDDKTIRSMIHSAETFRQLSSLFVEAQVGDLNRRLGYA